MPSETMPQLSDADRLLRIVQLIGNNYQRPLTVLEAGEIVSGLRAIAERLQRPGVEDGFMLSNHEFRLLKEVIRRSGNVQMPGAFACANAAERLREAIHQRTGKDFEVYT